MKNASLCETATLASTDECPKESDTLIEILADIENLIPPLWPLQDFVAVNPFLGWSDQPMTKTIQAMRELRDCRLLMPPAHFREKLTSGQIETADLETALRQCSAEDPDAFGSLTVDEVMHWAETSETDADGPDRRRYSTLAERVDRQRGMPWQEAIIEQISQHCAAHYDEGQAVWKSPWKDRSLYEAWRISAVHNRRMHKLGLKDFHRLIGELPEAPQAAINHILDELSVPERDRKSYLLCVMYSIAGWASYVKYRVREAEWVGQADSDLVGLLAIRLAFELGIARAGWVDLSAVWFDGDSPSRERGLSPDIAAGYVWQVAAEQAYRRSLLTALKEARETGRSQPGRSPSARPAAQMVFCIDVRSEVLRRHLEAVNPDIDTFGFAGFFGLPLEHVPPGADHGPAQCPVLLSPAFTVREEWKTDDPAMRSNAHQQQQHIGAMKRIWKRFKMSAASCFPFVEALGLFYLTQLPGKHGGGSSRRASSSHRALTHEVPFEQQVEMAEGILRNLGLTEGFARLVVLCGHGSDVANNPYRASLDCGACGGHSGAVNARVAAGLLNDPRVRQALASRDLLLPEDTWVLPALHHTTTDEIELLDRDDVPATLANDLSELEDTLTEAGRLTRAERSRRMGNVPAEDLFRRSGDWSEVRPEWALAGNAAFIVAPRERTRGLDLGGRTFMHSYDHRRDPDHKVLELIMTAPMVVASWINLQYYASTVDNRSFGSGNKAIHNVVGQLGILEGNGGDLMTGLPWQSVHDGNAFQHEPLRLLTVIEAPRDAIASIIQKHSSVRDLVGNGWVNLVALDGDEAYLWTGLREWQPMADGRLLHA